jgi:hypothetical protein
MEKESNRNDDERTRSLTGYSLISGDESGFYQQLIPKDAL